MYKRVTSFSQNSLFEGCQRAWFLKYIQKLPVKEDMCYADAGKVIHKCIESFYGNGRSIEKVKGVFESEWFALGLPDSKIAYLKPDYWSMVVNAANLNKDVTSVEHKIFFDDVVGYIDAINSKTGEIFDWKSSTRRWENEEDYLKQLKFYSYLYFRKFGKLPSKATVHYLKHQGADGELAYLPNIQDVFDAETWHKKVRMSMESVESANVVPRYADACMPFCPFKSVCDAERSSVMDYEIIVFDNCLRVNGFFDETLHNGFRRKFSYVLKNAVFMKRYAPRARTTICFWSSRRQVLPLGFLEGAVKTIGDYAKFKGKEAKITVSDRRSFDGTKVVMPDAFLNGVVLRDYQFQAVDEFLKHKFSLLELATGSGKTEIAIEIIRRLGMKTLFVVDRIELLKQTKERIEKALGIEVGVIGGSTSDIKDVTVAMIQTLSKNYSRYKVYLNSVRFAVFDECHKVAAKTYVQLANYLVGTEYRLGISATAFRDDGNDMMISASVGYKVMSLGSRFLVDQGWLVMPRIVFLQEFMPKDVEHKLEQDCKALTSSYDVQKQYNDFYDVFVTNNEYRNKAIVDLVNKHVGKKILILVKRVQHGENLQKMIEGSFYLHGETGKVERDEVFEKFVKGDLKVLVSTISIFAEGVDVPTLDMVINASANKGDTKTIQVLGRVLRKIEGKTGAAYFDFFDGSKFFRFASYSRRKTLFNQGYPVEQIALENLR